MLNFPTRKISTICFPGFPVPSNIRQSFPNFVGTKIQKKKEIVEKFLWTPADITTALWLDADDISTFTVDGSNNISQWADKSGNNLHMVGGATEPVLGDKTVIFSEAASGTFTTPYSTTGAIFYVLKPNDATYLLFNEGSHNYILTADSGSGVTTLYDGSGTPTIYFDGEIPGWANRGQVYTALYDRTSIICLDEVNLSAWGTPTVLAGYPVAGYSYNGEIKEIIYIDGTLSSINRKKIEGYLAHKWGLEENLPSDHLFKDEPPYRDPFVEDLLWTPADITTALWLDAADDSTVTIDTGVSVWADKSGNSLDFSQGNTVLQPAYVTNYENGLNALSFAGHSLSRLETVGDDVSLFIAFKPRTTIPSLSLWSLITQKSGTLYSEYLLINYTGYSDLTMKNDFSSSGAAVGLDLTITADQPEIFCFTYNDGLNTDVSNYGIYRNGTTETVITTSNLGRSGGESACIGSRNSEDFFFDGHIYEIITVSGVVDTDTRQQIEGYLAHKWGFEANLPSDHPYKDVPPYTTNWLGTWANRIPITIDHTKIDSDLTHFPVPIVLSGSDAEAVIAEVGSNNKKIAVALSDKSQLYCEIEQWDTVNNKICIWVSRSDWIISSSEDDTIYLYYDSTQADNTTYVGDPSDTVAQNVWNSNLISRFGMSQDPTGGTDCIIDSTGNENHGTPAGTMTAGDLVDGNIGKALDFDGSDDYISLGNDASLSLDTAITIQALINPDSVTGFQGILAKGFDASAINYYFRINDGALQFYFRNSANTSNRVFTSGTSPITTSSWQYVVFGHEWGDDTSSLFRLDDADLAGSWNAGGSDLPKTNTQSVAVASRGDDQDFNGKIGEIRIFNTLLTEAWLKADYYAQTNNLLSLGTIEENS